MSRMNTEVARLFLVAIKGGRKSLEDLLVAGEGRHQALERLAVAVEGGAGEPHRGFAALDLLRQLPSLHGVILTKRAREWRGK